MGRQIQPRLFRLTVKTNLKISAKVGVWMLISNAVNTVNLFDPFCRCNADLNTLGPTLRIKWRAGFSGCLRNLIWPKRMH